MPPRRRSETNEHRQSTGVRTGRRAWPGRPPSGELHPQRPEVGRGFVPNPGRGHGGPVCCHDLGPRAAPPARQGHRLGGRTHEIQRLIGRSLRGVVDLAKLGERTITVDCDVLQADGGTRCASITGGYVALAAALTTYGMERLIAGKVAAVSVGVNDGIPILDLDYAEDSHAEVDFNVVGTDAGTYVELQGTAEGRPFDRARVDALLDLANVGLTRLFEAQGTALASVRRSLRGG